jgi:hypothetical protein
MVIDIRQSAHFPQFLRQFDDRRRRGEFPWHTSGKSNGQQ